MVLLEGGETANEAHLMLVVGAEVEVVGVEAEAEAVAAAWYLSSGSMERESAVPPL